MLDLFAPETTIAYLTLPGSLSQYKHFPLCDIERDDKTFYVESGYAMPVKLPQPLSKKSLKAFKLTMARLGLQPFVPNNQKGMALAADGSEDDKEGSKQGLREQNEEECKRGCVKDGKEMVMAKDVPDWPQLMMLTQCTAYFDSDA